MQQKCVEQGVSTVREGGCSGSINACTARRSFGRSGQDQRPRYNYRPQAQHSSKHPLN